MAKRNRQLQLFTTNLYLEVKTPLNKLKNGNSKAGTDSTSALKDTTSPITSQHSLAGMISSRRCQLSHLQISIDLEPVVRPDDC